MSKRFYGTYGLKTQKRGSSSQDFRKILVLCLSADRCPRRSPLVRRSFAARSIARSLERVSHVPLTYLHIKILQISNAYSESSTFDEPSTPNHHHHPSSPSVVAIANRRNRRASNVNKREGKRIQVTQIVNF